jgi:hypothetical protein
MTTLLENYRRFNFTRFVYETGESGPKTLPPVEGGTESGEHGKEGEGKEPVKLERPDVQKFNTKVDVKVAGAKITLDEQDKKDLQEIKDGYAQATQRTEKEFEDGSKEEVNELKKEQKIWMNEVDKFIKSEQKEERQEKKEKKTKGEVAPAAEPAKAEEGGAKAEAAGEEDKEKPEAKDDKAEAKETEEVKKAAALKNLVEICSNFLINSGNSDVRNLIEKGKEQMASVGPEKIIEEMRKDAPWIIEASTNFINTLPEVRLDLLSGPNGAKEFKMTQEEDHQFNIETRKAFEKSNGKIETVDDAEVAIINKLEITINKKTQKVVDLFGEDFAKTLSMRYEIKAVESSKDSIQIRKNGTTEWGTKNIKELGPYVKVLGFETDIYDQIVNNKIPEGKLPEVTKGFKSICSLDNYLIKELGKVDTTKIEGLKQKGPLELISTLIQLWSVLQQALKDKDFNTLGDMMKDLQQRKNPMESMKQAENTYKQKINTMTEPSDILALYNDPRGKEATAKFGETPYRGTIKKVIQERMEGALDMDITKIESEKGGTSTKISGTKDNKQFEISISKDGKMTKEEVVAVVDNSGEIRRAETQLNNKQNELTELKKDTTKTAEATSVQNEITLIGDKIKDLEAKNGKGDRKKIEGEPDAMYRELKDKLIASATAEPPAEPKEQKKPEDEGKVAATDKPAGTEAKAPTGTEAPPKDAPKAQADAPKKDDKAV